VHLNVQNVEKQLVETKTFAWIVVNHSILSVPNVAMAGGLCLITNFALPAVTT
jgi:hypothetical protein